MQKLFQENNMENDLSKSNHITCKEENNNNNNKKKKTENNKCKKMTLHSWSKKQINPRNSVVYD